MCIDNTEGRSLKQQANMEVVEVFRPICAILGIRKGVDKLGEGVYSTFFCFSPFCVGS